jgi:protein-S-isoprenylcysteine O-methyltransferase Ste14
MKRLLRSLLICSPALLLYFAALPWVALRLDRWLGLVWRLPSWIEPVAATLVLAGAALAIWSFRALTVLGHGTPNPLVPTARLVESGPFRHSRNPLMLGGWLCGAGLACLLRSPSLLVLVGFVVVAGVFYVRWIEEPGLLSRYGEGWLRYAGRTPRWLPLALAAVAILGGLPAMSRDIALSTKTEPAILVQIRCKPGTADLWRADFDQHIRPAIEDVLARGDTFTGFQFLQPVLPWQGFDFVLLYTGASFAGLDRPRPFPQYVALFQREGSLRTLAALKEMGSWEDQVSVTLVHSSRSGAR